MEEKKVSTLFEEIKDDLSDYVSKRQRLLKLEVNEKVSKGSSSLLYTIGALILIALALNFILATLALYLSTVFNSLILGFLTVSIVAILIVAIILMRGKSIRKGLTNMILSLLMTDDKD